MPTWDAGQYLKFAEERTQPCRDLAARAAALLCRSPKTVIDVGCGPGNSAAVLAETWPSASLTGLDNSADMIATATRSHPNYRWITNDLATWAIRETSKFDIVFSNAALQWVEDHPAVFPRLLERVSASGLLAIQVPANIHAPAHRIMRELATSSRWITEFPSIGVREWHVLRLGDYYDLLAPHAGRLDLWQTEYIHLLPNADAIVEWYRGTGMRPYLQALHSDAQRNAFAAEFRDAVADAYPAQSDGTVLFPFQRLFILASPR